MAQAYNHIIMPLATSRDKRTQVIWGVRDFESRFGRRPEGMWLPETAVDLESLDIMAEFGVKFTVLAPRQAEAVRDPAAGGLWREAENGGFDTRRPYLCRLPSGRTIALFFYDGAIAHDLAFGGLLRNGEDFARRLAGAFSGEAGRPELVHVATDGESYGHHHRFGEMALAYALRHIERNGLAEITVYGDFLERFPPAAEVRIRENTSWSCAHGLGRWQCDCACNSGAHEGWSQAWRAPLREAMTWLGERAAEVFETGLGAFAPDPWAVRDDYIRVILDRSPRNVETFLKEHAGRRLAPAEKAGVLGLLELARHAMLIFTSDGWFFDDISNIETVQIIQYAARAMELARAAGGPDLEPEFVRRLEPAKSNVRRHRNGAYVYETLVRPAKPDVLHPCGRGAGARARGRGAESEIPSALLGRGVAALVDAWAAKPEEVAGLEKIEAALSALKGAGLEPDLWRAQNVFFAMAKDRIGKASIADVRREAPEKWLHAFRAVAELLRFDLSVLPF
jgi:alpha-amylase/alpha-mannosidase (GH57 family)